MSRRHRRWRRAFWLATVTTVSLSLVWIASYFVEFWVLTNRHIDSVSGLSAQEVTEFRAMGYNIRGARLDYVVWGGIVIDNQIFVVQETVPQWRFCRPSVRRSNIRMLPARFQDGSILIPIWPFVLILAFLALMIRSWSPQRRAFRANSVWVERISPSPRVRMAWVLLCALSLLSIAPYAALALHAILLQLRVLSFFTDEAQMAYFIPLFTCAGGALVLTVAVNKHLRWRRARVDRPECIHCRYNLTANESGKCPECGNPIHPRQAAWLAEHADPSASISIHLRPISSKEGTADERG